MRVGAFVCRKSAAMRRVERTRRLGIGREDSAWRKQREERFKMRAIPELGVFWRAEGVLVYHIKAEIARAVRAQSLL